MSQPQGQPFDQDQALRILRRLKFSLQHYKKTPADVFDYYNQKGGDAVLDFMEFSRLMIKMEPSLSQDEAGQLFYLFNKDGQGITKEKFVSVMDSVPLEQCTKQQEEMGKIALGKIIQAMNVYNIDVATLFDVYDKEDDCRLTYPDLQVMLQRIDRNLTHEECIGACLILDKDGDQSITFKEFKSKLAQARQQPEQ